MSDKVAEQPIKSKEPYEPFGDQWFLEMKKWNKTVLIGFLRTTLIELKDLKDAASKQVGEENRRLREENEKLKVLIISASKLVGNSGEDYRAYDKWQDEYNEWEKGFRGDAGNKEETKK